MSNSNLAADQQAYSEKRASHYARVADAETRKCKDLKERVATLKLHLEAVGDLEKVLEEISREEYPVGGNPTRRQLSQIKIKCVQALEAYRKTKENL